MNQLAVIIITIYVIAAQKTELIKPHHTSLESCAKACLEAGERCRFFRFMNITGTCYLSSHNPGGFDERNSSFSVKLGSNVAVAADLKDLMLKLKEMKEKWVQIKNLEHDLTLMKTGINQRFAALINQGKGLSAGQSKNTDALKKHVKILVMFAFNIHAVNKAFEQLHKVQSEIRSDLDKVLSGRNVSESFKYLKSLMHSQARRQHKYGKWFAKSFAAQKIIWKAVKRVNKRLKSVKSQTLPLWMMRKLVRHLVGSAKKWQSLHNRMSSLQRKLKQVAAMKTFRGKNIQPQIAVIQNSLKIFQKMSRKLHAIPMMIKHGLSKHMSAVYHRLARIGKFNAKVRSHMVAARRRLRHLSRKMAALVASERSLQMQLNQQSALTSTEQNPINLEKVGPSPMFVPVMGKIHRFEQVLAGHMLRLQKGLQALSHSVRKQGNMARIVKAGLHKAYMSMKRKMNSDLQRIFSTTTYGGKDMMKMRKKLHQMKNLVKIMYKKLRRSNFMEMRTMSRLSKSMRLLKARNERFQRRANKRLLNRLHQMMMRTVKQFFTQAELARQNNISRRIKVGLHVFARTMKDKLNYALRTILRKMKSRLPRMKLRKLNNEMWRVKTIVHNIYRQLRKKAGVNHRQTRKLNRAIQQLNYAAKNMFARIKTKSMMHDRHAAKLKHELQSVRTGVRRLFHQLRTSQHIGKMAMLRLFKPLMSMKMQNMASSAQTHKDLRHLFRVIARQRNVSRHMQAGQHSLARSMKHRLGNAVSRIMRKSVLTGLKPSHIIKLKKELQLMNRAVHKVYHQLRKSEFVGKVAISRLFRPLMLMRDENKMSRLQSVRNIQQLSRIVKRQHRTSRMIQAKLIMFARTMSAKLKNAMLRILRSSNSGVRQKQVQILQRRLQQVKNVVQQMPKQLDQSQRKEMQTVAHLTKLLLSSKNDKSLSLKKLQDSFLKKLNRNYQKWHKKGKPGRWRPGRGRHGRRRPGRGRHGRRPGRGRLGKRRPGRGRPGRRLPVRRRSSRRFFVGRRPSRRLPVRRPSKRLPVRRRPVRKLPGRRRPGRRRPGRRRPGRRLPGRRRPGRRLPGKRRPGRKLSGRRRPSKRLPVIRRPSKILPVRSSSRRLPGRRRPTKILPVRRRPVRRLPGRRLPVRRLPFRRTPVRRLPVRRRPVRRLPVRRPSRKLPVKRPSRRLPVRRPSRRLPVKRPNRRLPVIRPVRRLPVKRPSRKFSVKRPSRRLPVRRPNRKLPVIRPVRRLPVRRPSRRLPVIRPVRRLPVRRPSRRLPVKRPSRRLPVGRPVRRLPVRRPNRLPVIRPVRRLPVKRPTRKFSVKRPSRRLPVRRPSRRLPVKRPSRRLPVRRTPVRRPSRLPVIRPVRRLPVKRPSRTLPVKRPSRKLPVKRPSRGLPVIRPVRRLPVRRPSRRLPVRRKSSRRLPVKIRRLPVRIRRLPVRRPSRRLPVRRTPSRRLPVKIRRLHVKIRRLPVKRPSRRLPVRRLSKRLPVRRPVRRLPIRRSPVRRRPVRRRNVMRRYVIRRPVRRIYVMRRYVRGRPVKRQHVKRRSVRRRRVRRSLIDRVRRTRLQNINQSIQNRNKSHLKRNIKGIHLFGTQTFRNNKRQLHSRQLNEPSRSFQPFLNRDSKVKKDTGNAVSSCPRLFTASNVGSFCFLTSTNLMTSDAATEYCRQYHGALVTVETKDKEAAVQDFLKRNRYEGEHVWMSRVIIKEGITVWDSNRKPVLLNQFKDKMLPFEDTCTLFDVTKGAWLTVPCGNTDDMTGIRFHRAMCEPALSGPGVRTGSTKAPETIVNEVPDRVRSDTRPEGPEAMFDKVPDFVATVTDGYRRFLH